MADYNITLTTGAQGVPGQGVKPGGNTGQYLIKSSNADFDTAWVSSTAVVEDIGDIGNVDTTGVANNNVLAFVDGTWVASGNVASAAQGALAQTAVQPATLTSALAGKANTVHTHVKANITDFNDSDYATAAQGSLAQTAVQPATLTSALAGKANTVHVHVKSDITNFSVLASDVNSQTAANGHVLTSNGAGGAVWSAVPTPNVVWGGIGGTIINQTDLQSALGGKANTVHTHVKSDITDFNDSDYATAAQGSLADSSIQPGDNVSTLVNDANYVNNNTVVTLLSGKANTVHTHVKADIVDFVESDYATNAQGLLADSALQPGDNVSALVNDSGYLTSVVAANVNSETASNGYVLSADGSGGADWVPFAASQNAVWGFITGTLSSQTDLQSALDGKANTVHTHVKSDITDFDESDYASNAQGLLADTAVQPGDNVSVLVNDANYINTNAVTTLLDGKANTVHYHVKADITDFADSDYATNAQGLLADSALQPGDNVSVLLNDSGYLTVVTNTNITTTSPFGCVLTSNGDGTTFWNLGNNITVQWGNLTGNVADQTDLQSALDGKANTVHYHVKADITDFDETDYASNAQGLLADSSIQPGDNVSTLVNDANYVNNNTVVTLLAGKANTVHTHVKADIVDFSDGDYATAAQGSLADSAVQPNDNVSVLVNDANYVNNNTVITLLSGKANTVHTHVKADIVDFADSDYATNAQGLLADSAVQPGDNVSSLLNDANYLTSLSLDGLSDVTITLPSPAGPASNAQYLGTGYGGFLKGYELVAYSRDGGSPETYSWKNVTINEVLASIGESPVSPILNFGLLTYDRAGDAWVVVGNQFFEEGTTATKNAGDAFLWNGTNYYYGIPTILAGNVNSETATDGWVLTADGAGGAAWEAVTAGSATWGSITGTLSSQTDLQSALDGKANTVHTHVAADINSETATDGWVLTSNGSGGAAWEAVAAGDAYVKTTFNSTAPVVTIGGDSVFIGESIRGTQYGTSVDSIYIGRATGVNSNKLSSGNIFIGASSGSATSTGQSYGSLICIGVNSGPQHASSTVFNSTSVGQSASGKATESLAVGYQAVAGTSGISSSTNGITAIGHRVNNQNGYSFRAGSEVTNQCILHVKELGRLYVQGTQAGYVAPGYATGSEPTAVEGQIIFDSTTKKLKLYNGTAWETITSS
jgi:hypothetical protein